MGSSKKKKGKQRRAAAVAASGILSNVLSRLKLCEYETFNTNNTQNLQSPSNWIRVLITAVNHEPSSSMLIAKNIGPLVSFH